MVTFVIAATVAVASWAAAPVVSMAVQGTVDERTRAAARS